MCGRGSFLEGDPMKEKSKVVSVRMTTAEHEELRLAAEQEGTNATEFMREALLHAIAGSNLLTQVRRANLDMHNIAQAQHEQLQRMLQVIEGRMLSRIDERIGQLATVAIEAGAQMAVPGVRSS